MERRVAKFLNGDRTPLSGAGAAKGDVMVPFENRPGRFLIECKLTEQYHADQPCLKVSKAWLKKIQTEAEQMRALFGALVVHYHNHTPDFVLVRLSDIAKVHSVTDLKLHTRVDLNRPTSKSFPLYRKTAALSEQGPIAVTVDYVVYLLMTLADFKEMVNG